MIEPSASAATVFAALRPPAVGERAQLGKEIAAYIRQLIMSGRLRSGQRLNVDAMARELKTSTTPIRDALLLLHGEGFVTLEPRRGFRIAPLSQQDVEDMFLMQATIAGELAERAVLAGSEHFIGAIIQLQNEMNEAHCHSNSHRMEQLNFEFHRIINRAAHSPKLTWLLDFVIRYMPRAFYSEIPGWDQASLRDHQEIIAAISNRDAESARRTMEKHVRHAGALLVSHLQKENTWPTSEERPSL